jgi:predicted amidohydrolase YtcJ
MTMIIGGLATLDALASAKTLEVEADVVFRNGFIYTVDNFHSRSKAVAIKDGKFIKIGGDGDMKPVTGKGTEVINLKGKMVMPGIIDSHIHAVRGGLGQLFFCQFPVESNVEEIQAAIKKCVAKKKKGEWVEGKTWDSALSKKVTAAMLDKVAPDNPVYLHDDTNHLGWLNSAALKAAKITKATPDPAGGHIGRDKDGNPTGVIYDGAAALVIKAMTPPTPEQLRKAATWIFDKLNAYGVTAAVLAQLDKGRLDAYRAMEKDGDLTIRLQGSWDFNTRYATEPIDKMAERFATREKRGPVTDLINPDGIKIYADGVWIGYGSPFIDMYETGETYGRQSIDQPTMKTWVTRFDKEGLKVMIHAVGDQAVRNSLNAVAAARRANGPGGPRHHIGHNTFVHADDRARAKDLNIVLEVSPANTWYPSSYSPSFVELLGPARVSQMVPIGELARNGAILVYGSDWDNVPEPDPWLGLETLVTRVNPDYPELGVLGPDQRVDLETAIEIVTINGAHTMELEKVTGSIEVGKDADMIVLDRNLFKIPVEKIHETKVLRTVLKGKTVYERK